MKNFIVPALISVVLASCGNNTADSSKKTSESSLSDTIPASMSKDTNDVQGTGTDRMPSRTGATGQGNTTVTGAATGSPTGAAKDTTK